MPDPSRYRHRLTDHDDAEMAQYQALSSLAVAGLVVGLLGFTALLELWLLGVPLLGLLLSGLALWRIARNTPALAGRKAALVGLVLSVLFAAAAPLNWLVYRGLVRSEARRFAACWFEFLADDQPHKAHQLTLHPKYREPFDRRLWDSYRKRSGWIEELQRYVAPSRCGSPALVRTLLLLGRKARVRYYETTDQTRSGKRDLLRQVYAVTYPEDGQEKTFFVGLELERRKLDSGRANWRVLDAGLARIDVPK